MEIDQDLFANLSLPRALFYPPLSVNQRVAYCAMLTLMVALSYASNLTLICYERDVNDRYRTIVHKLIEHPSYKSICLPAGA